VEQVDTELDIGSMVYRPEKVMMYKYDGDAIFAELNAKIDSGAELTDMDILNLIFLPLMRITIPRGELAVKSATLANRIPDAAKRNACIAATFAFAQRFLDEENLEKLMEVLRMTELATMMIEREVEKAVGEAVEKAVGEAVEKAVGTEKLEIAKNLLAYGLSVEAVAKNTGLDEGALRKILSEQSEE
jgi:predicted transposase/invertase (TIGR01784 family)